MRKRISMFLLAMFLGFFTAVVPFTEVETAKAENVSKKAVSEELPGRGTILKEFSTKNSYTVLKKGKTVAFQKAGNKNVNIAAVPDKVKFGKTTYKVVAVLDRAFQNNKNLRSVTIGKNVTRIGKDSFGGCKKLSKMVIRSQQLKKVGDNAIKGIRKKAVIDVPNQKKKQYKKLFKDKTGYLSSMKIK
ncbi:MAG: leucine-rich repeat protein [Lachnospiraceae bacterium]